MKVNSFKMFGRGQKVIIFNTKYAYIFVNIASMNSPRRRQKYLGIDVFYVPFKNRVPSCETKLQLR